MKSASTSVSNRLVSNVTALLRPPGDPGEFLVFLRIIRNLVLFFNCFKPVSHSRNFKTGLVISFLIVLRISSSSQPSCTATLIQHAMRRNLSTTCGRRVTHSSVGQDGKAVSMTMARKVLSREQRSREEQKRYSPTSSWCFFRSSSGMTKLPCSGIN